VADSYGNRQAAQRAAVRFPRASQVTLSFFHLRHRWFASPRAAGVCLLLAFVFLTRWPFRSHALFSWDSANYALALERIDIRAHRPHPPGYLGYVLVGRALNGIVRDPNAALVMWNVLVTAISALILAAFAHHVGEVEIGERRKGTVVASVAILLTSPLLWFYGEIAEIYPSELLVSLLIAYSAWHAARGSSRAAWIACPSALALAALFKPTAAILMFPLVAYAWWRRPWRERRNATFMTLALCGTVLTIFLTVQPDLFRVLWDQLISSTGATRLVGTGGGSNVALRTFNRNLRDTLTAALSALGALNVLGLVAWLAIDRRLPKLIDRTFVCLWLIPWPIVFFGIHFGKPGYLLPLLPLLCLLLGDFYARQSRPAMLLLVIAQGVVNAAQFVLLRPAAPATLGSTLPYRSETVLQRVASDLQTIAFPTVSTIQESDTRVAQLRGLVASVCPSSDPIIIGDVEPVDWRRVMWYWPSALAVHQHAGKIDMIGRNTDLSLVTDDVLVDTSCPVIWLSSDESAVPLNRLFGTASVPGLGWTSAAGRFRVGPDGLFPVR
jgi:Protein of unknown function (DUF2723)